MRKTFFLLLMILSINVFGQTDDEIFNQALEYYNAKQYSKCVPILEKLTKKNYPRAYNLLGYFAYKGFTETVDYDKAYEYYKRSAELGFDGAMINLGNMFYDACFVDYENDENNENNDLAKWAEGKKFDCYSQARKWLTMAVKADGLNCAKACYWLAETCYFPGDNEPWGDGFPLLKKSAELGHVDAMIGAAFEDKLSNAVTWLQKAKAAGAKKVTWLIDSEDITIDEMITIFQYCESSKKWEWFSGVRYGYCAYAPYAATYLIAHSGNNVVTKLDEKDGSEFMIAVFSPKKGLIYTIGKPKYNIDYENVYYNEDKKAWHFETSDGDVEWLDLSGSKPRVIATEKNKN